MSVCSSCEVEKPATEFQSDDRYATGHKSHCKKCSQATTERWRVRQMGFSDEQIPWVQERRRGPCEVCGKPEKKKRLAMDHDHETGLFRGFLCGHCNRALGLLQDDPATIRALADYIERTSLED